MMDDYKANWRGNIVSPYWTKIPYLTWKPKGNNMWEQIPLFICHYKQGFLSLQGEEEAVRFGGLSLLFSFLYLTGFPYFKGRLWKTFKREEFCNYVPYFLED
jgi:hypothetical protein